MSTNRYHGGQTRAQIEEKLKGNVLSATIFVQRAARQNARSGGSAGLNRVTGHLVNSIVYETDQFTGRVGSSLVYARLHELGGKIVPKAAGALAIPVHPDAKRASGPRDFGGELGLIKRPGRPPLLIRARDVGKGKRNRDVFDIMYVLMKSVRIPARPYLRPALAANMDRIRAILARGIEKGSR